MNLTKHGYNHLGSLSYEDGCSTEKIVFDRFHPEVLQLYLILFLASASDPQISRNEN